MRDEQERLYDNIEILRNLISRTEHYQNIISKFASQEERITKLEKELEKAQRNDMPKHPDTGKFFNPNKKK